MDRRTFIKSAGVAAGGAAAAAAFPMPAISQGLVEWRMVTTWPKNFPGLGVGAQRLADRIAAATNGRLTVKVYSAGELVPALQAIDAVIDGSAEMSHGAAYYWQNKSVALALFTGVPYGMTSQELRAWVNFMGGQQLYDEIYAQFGVKGFLNGDTGTQACGWFKNELTGLADIQGLRFRTPGLGGRAWQMLGASVVNLAGGEIYQALQSGTLDAAEFVGPYNDLALGFYQVAKNYYFPTFTEPGLATELAINKARFDALPQDIRGFIADICQAECDQMASDFYANDPPALRTLVEDHGVVVRQTPEDILQAGAEASKTIITELRDNSDPLVKKTIEAYIAAFNQLRTRTEFVDLRYMEARQKYFTIA